MFPLESFEPASDVPSGVLEPANIPVSAGLFGVGIFVPPGFTLDTVACLKSASELFQSTPGMFGGVSDFFFGMLQE
jgi:hypothetical protein